MIGKARAAGAKGGLMPWIEITLMLAVVLFAIGAFNYWRTPAAPTPYYWGLIAAGLFFWSLSDLLGLFKVR